MADPQPIVTEFPSQWAGADWLERSLKVQLSPLGRKVGDILGIVFRGIYHLRDRDLRATEWGCDWCIQIRLPRDLATWDGWELTALVVLCHDGGIRLEISAHTFNHLKLMFHQRESREGGMSERLPSIESQIASVRKLYGAAAAERES